MTSLPYKLALIIYAAAALGLFTGIGIELITLLQMRSARSVGQVQQWSHDAVRMQRIAPLCGVVAVAAGAYLFLTSWTWPTPYLVVILASLVLIAVLLPVVGGRALGLIRYEADHAMPGAVPSRLAEQIRDPVLWASVQIAAGLALAVIALAVVQPKTWLLSLGIGAAGAVLGALSSIPHFLTVGPFARHRGRPARGQSRTSQSSK